MPFFQSTLGRIQTGNSYLNLERVQGLNINVQLNRTDSSRIGDIIPESRPFSALPRIVSTINYIKSDKEIEYAIGLVSGASIISNLLNSQILGFGVRNYDFIISDRVSLIPSGALITLTSGVLTNYSINANVGQNAECSFSVEALDFQVFTNTIPEVQLNVTGAYVVKQENLSISNITLTGLGISDLSLQSFNFNIDFGRTPEFSIGEYYPNRRDLTGPIIGKVTMLGYAESFSNTTGLSKYQNGDYYNGNLVVSMSQSCANNPIVSTYTFKNPYISNFSYSEQVGGYIAFNLELETPVSLQSEGSKSSIIMI